MEEKIDKEWFLRFGILWHHLLSLELLLRFCVYRKKDEEHSLLILTIIKKGDILKMDSLINCNTLNEVIEIFNSMFRDDGMIVNQDKIMRLRNTLGHGKILAIENFPTKIYNFSRVDNLNVKVEFIETMTKDWFDTNIDFVTTEITKLNNFYRTLRSTYEEVNSHKKRIAREVKCPFCGDKNIKHIDDLKLVGSNKKRSLYKCKQLGEFFWGDNGDKFQLVSYYCKTRQQEHEKCNEEILNFFEYSEKQSLKKVKKLDLICSKCPNIKISFFRPVTGK